MLGKFKLAWAYRAIKRKCLVRHVHSLENNYNLTKQEYAYCVALINRIQDLYDNVGAYADRNGVDRTLIFPGNEWAEIVPRSGLRFRTRYEDVNYLRLSAPFAGYHLLILDRLDVRSFPEPWTDEFVAKIAQEGIPKNIVQLVRDRIDPAERLMPIVDEYLQHIRHVPRRYVVHTPRIFGEIGIEVNGVLVNPDVILCQSRINGMLSSGVLDKLDADIACRGHARVLEIGPGYGSLAYALKNIFGERLEYIAVDLPSSLYFAAIYLSTLAGGEGCYIPMPSEEIPEHFNFLFVANYMLDELSSSLGPIDLALNTMSFPEMTVAQVRYYGELFKKLLRNDGIVFEENAAIKPHHADIKAIFSDIFPFRKRVSSDVVTTKNWCQDVWSSRYLGQIFDCSDLSLNFHEEGIRTAIVNKED